MKYQIKLNYAEVNLKVAVKTDSPQKLRLKVYDATNPNRVFTNRYKTVTGEENLFVRMPLSPETAASPLWPMSCLIGRMTALPSSTTYTKAPFVVVTTASDGTVMAS